VICTLAMRLVGHRGSHYYSNTFCKQVLKHDLIGCMSRKGCCYDNASAENISHTLKVELIHGETIATRDSMKKAVFEYVEVEYNHTCLHSSNDYFSSLEIEIKLTA
jgi:putative transposase